MVAELGVLHLKGHVDEDIYPETDKYSVKHIEFMCPNPECKKHPRDSILGMISLPIAKEGNNHVWTYTQIDDKHISISPSILCRDDFHCGIPTYFELVDTREELYGT